MAERLKTRLLEKDDLVDVVCGPDAYRDLPRLLAVTNAGQTAGNSCQKLANLVKIDEVLTKTSWVIFCPTMYLFLV